jgi:hypothetical protein
MVEVAARCHLPASRAWHQRDDLVTGELDIIDVQVDVDLLRCPIGPLRRNMIGRASWMPGRASP